MTNFNDYLRRNTIGSDRILNTIQAMANASRVTSPFPHYNILKTGENAYKLELALAGFDILDINIEVEKQTLKISSNGHSSPIEYVFQGFSFKGFERVFQLMENMEVTSAEMANGILSVFMQKNIPEEQKPRKINIQAPTAKEHPTLLNEESVL